MVISNNGKAEMKKKQYFLNHQLTFWAENNVLFAVAVARSSTTQENSKTLRFL